jgi:hypothetical protein
MGFPLFVGGREKQTNTLDAFAVIWHYAHCLAIYGHYAFAIFTTLPSTFREALSEPFPGFL